MDLHEFAPVGGRAAGRRDGPWCERFTQVGEGLTSRERSLPGFRPLANLRFEGSRLLPAVSSEADVSATRWAQQGKLLTHPGHQLCPGNPGNFRTQPSDVETLVAVIEELSDRIGCVARSRGVN